MYSYYCYIGLFLVQLVFNLVEQQYEDFEIQYFVIAELITSNFICLLTLIGFEYDRFTFILFLSIPLLVKIVQMAKRFPEERVQSHNVEKAMSE